MNKFAWLAPVGASVLVLGLIGQSSQAVQATEGGASGPNITHDSGFSDQGTVSISFGSFARPTSVQRYYVECSDANVLNVFVSDGGISGDHWQVDVKVWDNKPNVATSSAPGGAGFFSAPAKVYSSRSKSLGITALIEIRYRDGIDVFGANGTLRVDSNGSCTPVLTDLGQTDEI